jgi:hypothetical protein
MMNREKLVSNVKHLLQSDERVSAVSSATAGLPQGRKAKIHTYPGAVYVTNRRVLFYAKLGSRETVKEIPYPAITSVSGSSGGFSARFTVFAGADRVEFTSVRAVDEVVGAIRDRVGAAAPAATSTPDAPAMTTVNAAPHSSPSDLIFEQLRKLGELRDAGVVTTQEFDSKKADLLNRI